MLASFILTPKLEGSLLVYFLLPYPWHWAKGRQRGYFFLLSSLKKPTSEQDVVFHLSLPWAVGMEEKS